MHQVQSPYDASATPDRHPLHLPSTFAFLLCRISLPSCQSRRPENLSPKDSLLYFLPTLFPAPAQKSRRRCVRPILMTHPLSRPCLGMSPNLPALASSHRIHRHRRFRGPILRLRDISPPPSSAILLSLGLSVALFRNFT
jgi:hypothetical protein